MSLCGELYSSGAFVPQHRLLTSSELQHITTLPAEAHYPYSVSLGPFSDSHCYFVRHHQWVRVGADLRQKEPSR